MTNRSMVAGLATALALCGGPARAFDYFEHRAVGQAAFLGALQTAVGSDAMRAAWGDAGAQLGFDVLPRWRASPLQLVRLGFGDLAALAGDFTDDVDDLRGLLVNLNEARALERPPPSDLMSPRAHSIIRATRLEWLAACTWFRRLSNEALDGSETYETCFDGQVQGNAASLAAPTLRTAGYRASRNQQSEYEQITKYAALASRNGNHFPTASWRQHATHHRAALAWADEYRRLPAGRTDERQRALREALLNEGFAQHFLHDSFASGHIGTETGDCLFWLIWCRPTLTRVQQTHDVLNEIGVLVRMTDVQDRPDPRPYLPAGDARRNGWTASGDGHLFLPETAVHRAMLFLTARASVAEVLRRAEVAPPSEDACEMCDPAIFPVPVNDFHQETEGLQGKVVESNGHAPPLIRFRTISFGHEKRSPDPRVPGLPVEGWKVGAGYGDQVVQRLPPGGRAVEGALVLRVDYIRPIEPIWPGSYGFEWWNAPNRGSAYMATVGWTYPREVARQTLTLKVKAGMRTEENFTATNPGPERHRATALALPSLEYNFEAYKPVSFYLQWNLFSYTFSDKRWTSSAKAGQRFNAGIRFDLAGI